MSAQPSACSSPVPTPVGQPDLRLVELVAAARARFGREVRIVWLAMSSVPSWQLGEHPVAANARHGGWSEVYRSDMWGFGPIAGIDCKAPPT